MPKQDPFVTFRVKPGHRLRLSDYDSAWTGKHKSKEEATAELDRNLKRITAAQDLLWASGRYALLIVLQAMDTAGKDGLISHVMSGMNPQGCQAFGFKQPTAEELSHHFLWRYATKLPARGRIGIFNRSYYEEVLVVRVHPEWLNKQNLPHIPSGNEIWKERYEDINNYEKDLTRNGTVILKFFLNISKGEQKKRLVARLDEPEKHWKFSASDLAERGFWPKYMEAYQDALSATSTEYAPWYVIPADHKWVSRQVVSDILASTVESLHLKLPKLSKEQKEGIAKAKKLLEA